MNRNVIKITFDRNRQLRTLIAAAIIIAKKILIVFDKRAILIKRARMVNRKTEGGETVNKRTLTMVQPLLCHLLVYCW